MIDVQRASAWWSRIVVPCCAIVALGCVVAGTPALAAPASFVASADQPLRFGTIVTGSGGSRTVGADGSTSNSGIFPLGDLSSGPAQFTLTYNSGSTDRRNYQLIFTISLPAVAKLTTGGVQGSLASFTTDLAGVPVLSPGQTAVYILPNCYNTICTVTFHVGGTLTITSASSRTNLTFPLVVLTGVLAVLG